MSFLDQPGDLAEIPLAAVLIEALNHRVTGVLTVVQDARPSRLFLRDGVPVAALSVATFRPLGHALLAAGAIDLPTLERSLAEMARSGRRQGEILVDLGAVTPAQVEAALTEQQTAYLSEIAALSSGQFSFDPSAPVPAWTAGVRIAPLNAIVKALETPQALPLVASALQPAAGGPIALAPGYRQLADAFGWSPAEAALVDRLAVLTTLDAFLADPGIAPERARAVVAALLLLGLAAPRSVSPEAVESVPALVVDLAEVAGVPVGAGLAGTVAPFGDGGGVAPPPRRSDPEEARRRRQRLLQRAMQNIGVGPLAGVRPAGGGGQTIPAAAPQASAPAPPPAPSAVEQELRRVLAAALPRARSADLFERLGVAHDAGRDAVKAAYLQLARQFHPDRFAAPALADLAPQVKDLFASLNEAYEVLSDEARRARYLARPGAAGGAGREGDERAAAVDFQKAEACARTRDFQRARTFYESALRADPRPEYQVGYAWALYAEPRPDRARARELAEAALRDPACDRAALLVGMLARDDGDDAAADRMFRRALQANPGNRDAERELRACEARRRRGTAPQGRVKR